jgi:signal transduction histidine kinase/DNA-binding response OmpR family regulator
LNNWNINKYNHFRKLNLSLLLLVTSIVLLSAQESYSFQNIGNKLFDVKKLEVEGAFLDNNIKYAYRDSRGFMWFGTEHGLCRYDGNGIIEFTTINSKLPFNNIHEIYEDDQGYLWILKNDVKPANIAFVNIHTLDFQNVEERFGDNLLFDRIIVGGKDRRIYFLSPEEEKGYVYENGKFSEVDYLIPFSKEYTGGKLLYETYKVHFQKTLFKPAKVNGEFRVLSNLGINKDGDVIIYSNKIGDQDKELKKVNSKGEITDLLSNPSLLEKIALNGHQVFLSRNHKTGDIWCFNNYQLTLYNPLEEDYYNFKVSHSDIFSERIFSVRFYDDLVWICAANGVFTIKMENNSFDNYLKADISKNYPSCRAIYTEDNEDILVATVNNLVRLSKDGVREISRYNHSPFIDKKGDTLLLGGGSINILVNDKLEHRTPFKTLGIWCSKKDLEQEGYWLGLVPGLGYWKPEMDTIEIYSHLNQYEELGVSVVFDFCYLNNENMLIASSTGIYEYSPSKGIIQRYWNGGDDSHYLPLNEYYYIYQDKEGIIWLASSGGGLLKWEKETGNYKQYTTDNGFSSNIICAIYEDEEENLWLPSYNGLIRFNKETEKIRIYKTEDGLTDNEFNRGAHFQSFDGKLYFGGVNGVNSFYPKKLIAAEKEKSVPLEVTSIYHFNSDEDKLIDKLELFRTEQEIVLYPNEEFINIGFSLLDYEKKGVTTYAYKIEGQSEQWQYIKDNQLRVSGLSYGKYILKIKGQMSNGSFSDKELLMRLNVLRPFYLQWWFIILSIFALLAAIVHFIKRNTRKLLERQEELENTVVERTAQIEKDKAIIEKQARELRELDKVKSRFFANISHELRTPITLIQGPVRSVLNNKNLGKDDEFLLTKVEENTEHLLSMVNELMDLTKAEAYKLEINESNVIFYDVLKRRLSSFQSLADMKSIQLDLEFYPNKDLSVALDIDKFEKIINNLLSNAFKFTPNEGKIKVTVAEENNDFLLEVKDTGRGIPQADIPFVFNRFYQSSINKKAEGGLGIGLSLSMEFVKLLGGKMWVESKEGHGSTFFVSLAKKEMKNISPDKPDLSSERIEPTELEIKNPINSPTTAISNIDSGFLSKQIILVVEDNLDLQEYLHYLLAPHYYEIHIVNNGKEALEWIAANKFPSLILSDLMMPIMDGFELLERVKLDKKLSSIPFVMLTARAELRDKLKALRIGVDDYLTKPFKEEELKVRINNLLSNFEERREYLMSEQPNHAVSKEECLPETSDNDRKWLENLEKTIIEEIGHHYFSVDYLAEKIDVKRDKLFKKTKALTGLTPNKYVRAVRLQLAKEFLENKEYKTVKEVAHKVGFQKIEYFSTLYKKQFGKSPSEYIR